jgi:hypothetical protein
MLCLERVNIFQTFHVCLGNVFYIHAVDRSKHTREPGADSPPISPDAFMTIQSSVVLLLYMLCVVQHFWYFGLLVSRYLAQMRSLV